MVSTGLKRSPELKWNIPWNRLLNKLTHSSRVTAVALFAHRVSLYMYILPPHITSFLPQCITEGNKNLRRCMIYVNIYRTFWHHESEGKKLFEIKNLISNTERNRYITIVFMALLSFYKGVTWDKISQHIMWIATGAGYVLNLESNYSFMALYPSCCTGVLEPMPALKNILDPGRTDVHSHPQCHYIQDHFHIIWW